MELGVKARRRRFAFLCKKLAIPKLEASPWTLSGSHCGTYEIPYKILLESCIIRKIVLYLYQQNKRTMMKEETMKLSELEADLIRAIRNYKRSYPNGYPNLLDYATRLFDKLTDPFDTEC